MHYLNSRYPNGVNIFVDCTRSIEGKIGIGIYIPSLTISVSLRLSDHLFPYSGEVIAIAEGVRYVIKHKILNSVIVSDCLSAVKDLESIDSLIRPHYITSLYEEVYSSGGNCSVVWVPGHCGLPHHDKADHLAKLSLTREIDIPVPLN